VTDLVGDAAGDRSADETALVRVGCINSVPVGEPMNLQAKPSLRTPHPFESSGCSRTRRTLSWPAEPEARLQAIDVLVLIDRLDDLVHNAKAVPLTGQVRIDGEEIYDILDQMRATIPEEIRQARWIVKERQEMLAEAKREVDRLLAEAREQAVREVSQTEIVKIAEHQAQDIVDDARRQARETRLEMEDWADGILSTLEVNLDKFLSAVKRGREEGQPPSATGFSSTAPIFGLKWSILWREVREKCERSASRGRVMASAMRCDSNGA
jgi:hypothetical protein